MGWTNYKERNIAESIILKIDLENIGSVIIYSDAVYTVESFEKILAVKNNINSENRRFINNARMLHYMKNKFNAKIFLGHDYEQATEWQNLGWID